MRPEEIEKESFRIIGEEAGNHGFNHREWQVVRRIIHTSADFEYLKSIRLHGDAISLGIAAIRAGKSIVTDTEMVRSGIRKRDLEPFGCRLFCLISDPEVKARAVKTAGTRAEAAVDMSLEQMDGGIYVVGNAPTALFRVLYHVKTGAAKPALIIGLPVGFVNAEESKEALIESGFPHISNQGRKGGSNVAASVVNALILMAGETSSIKGV